MCSASQGLISASPSFKEVMACSMNAKVFFFATPIYSSAIMDSHAEAEANGRWYSGICILRQNVAFACFVREAKQATRRQGDKAKFCLAASGCNLTPPQLLIVYIIVEPRSQRSLIPQAHSILFLYWVLSVLICSSRLALKAPSWLQHLRGEFVLVDRF